ncbi:SMP-30/gluconolactonase/LRE family protein [Oleomonas cavernae]|uniref:SMP-30/gluconolactonase/LRE family protein n=1 Tax=Oleomonas cavernae TaxID=2320859 RepID=A0A418WBS1_9PROT|nr:SMP-30/gluconolactonase/LRE family protein [Oleomonas cavernae]RJF87378.1 SMP-30/gluconolactonase/LRE family protein [Oleomonas cavernae]
MPDNPLRGWRVDRDQVSFVGTALQRPECVLAEKSGDLWVADARGGVVHIAPSGEQRLIAHQAEVERSPTEGLEARLASGTLPNGLAFDAHGDILIANFGTDRLEVMSRKDGTTRVLLDLIDGKPIGKVNFVLPDTRGRLWITVSTRVNPWMDALRPDLADGYIILMDNQGARIVADGLAFTNEIRFDRQEEFLYVVETMGNHITRFKAHEDGTLSNREVFGPPALGPGAPDGIAFDAYGNLWVTMIMADRLLAITPEGDLLELLDDGNPAATAQIERTASGGRPNFGQMLEAKGTLAPWMASITFGGEDLKTVYLGSLLGTSLAVFRSPVAGLPMLHWK